MARKEKFTPRYAPHAHALFGKLVRLESGYALDVDPGVILRLVFDENLAAILPGVEPASPDSPYPRAKDAKPWVDRHVTVWGELFYDDLTGRPAFLFVRELSDPRPNDDVFGNLSTGRRRELPRGTVVNPRLTLADVVGSIEMTDEEFQQALDDLREIRKAR